VQTSPGSVSFTSLESVRTIHRVGASFQKAPFYEKLQLKGTLVCLYDIKEHSARRRHFSKAFSHGNLLEWEDVIKQHVRHAVMQMRDVGESGQEVDILKAFNRMASGIIGELVLGGSNASLPSVGSGHR
jgi:cytochrome P450